MNLSDIVKQAVNLEKELLNLKETINSLEAITQISEKWQRENISKILKNMKISNVNNSGSNAQKLTDENNNFYTNLLYEFRALNLSSSTFLISKMQGNFKEFKFDEFIEKFIDLTEDIHSFTASRDNKIEDILLFKVIDKIKVIIGDYKEICYKIDQTKDIGNTLIGTDEENTFNIRFLKENNEVSLLIENIALIQSIYDNVNSIIGGKSEKLRYRRAESGTFEISLMGNVSILGVVGMVLRAGYKVYTENLSWNAKQKKQLGEIKIRKEYAKLIKEYMEIKEKSMDMSDPTIQNMLANLEYNIQKLFCENPCIEIENEKIGVEANKEESIPVICLKPEEKGKLNSDNKKHEEKE